jgi:hypothetical protein
MSSGSWGVHRHCCVDVQAELAGCRNEERPVSLDPALWHLAPLAEGWRMLEPDAARFASSRRSAKEPNAGVGGGDPRPQAPWFWG